MRASRRSPASSTRSSPQRWMDHRALTDRRETYPAPQRSARALGERGLELGLEALLGHGALDALGLLAVAEQHHRRDREDLVVHRGLLVLVDVELDDPQVVALAGDLLEHRRDDPARTAPRRPEVDEHGVLGLEDLGLEVAVGHMLD